MPSGSSICVALLDQGKKVSFLTKTEALLHSQVVKQSLPDD